MSSSGSTRARVGNAGARSRTSASLAAAGFVMLATALTLGALGCSSDGERAEDVGRVGLQLKPGSGVVLNSISYSIVGPGKFTKAGTIDVSASPGLSAILSGIPAGGIYTISLIATAVDGATTCGGTATFSVSPGVTTPLVVHLDCHETARTGSVGVDGTVNICPGIDALQATPSQTVVGHTIVLSGAAHDTDNAPKALTYLWSTSAGSLSDPAAQNPTFTCTSVGSATITLTVSDGDGQPGCAATQTVTLDCAAPGDAGGEAGAGSDSQGGFCTFRSDSVVYNTDPHGTASTLEGPLSMTWSQSDNQLTEFSWNTYELVTINPYFNQIAATDWRQVFWDYAVTVGPHSANDGFAREIRGYVSNQGSAGSQLGSFSGLFEGASSQVWMGAQGTLDCDFGLSSGIHVTAVSPPDGSRINVGDGDCTDSTTHLTVASRDGRDGDPAVTASYQWTATFFGPDGVTPERSDVSLGTGADVSWAPALAGDTTTDLDPAACESGSTSSPTAGQRVDITVTASDSTGSKRSRKISVYALCTPC
jgi:hypothetical protein